MSIDISELGITSTDDISDNNSLSYKNIGWSLGNMCPMHCSQCYSRSTRESQRVITIPIIDKIIDELRNLQVETINLGGNEPIYTNGIDAKESLLPYIIERLHDLNIRIGITSAGPSLIELEKHFPRQLEKINDVDVSLDSPRKSEHDKNRGKKGIFDMAMKSLEICERYSIPKTIIMCAMKWNFTADRIDELIDMAIAKNANVRFNPLQPVDKKLFPMVLGRQQYYEGLYRILERCSPIELSDPLWATASGIDNKISGCPCGTSSFRIHSITADGSIPVSPCVYLHDFKFGDLTKTGIAEIIKSPPFKAFLLRKQNAETLEGCSDCNDKDKCRGGCAARAYLFKKHETGQASIFTRDPYCMKGMEESLEPRNNCKIISIAENVHNLVHSNYLCTGIFSPLK